MFKKLPMLKRLFKLKKPSNNMLCKEASSFNIIMPTTVDSLRRHGRTTVHTRVKVLPFAELMLIIRMAWLRDASDLFKKLLALP